MQQDDQILLMLDNTQITLEKLTKLAANYAFIPTLSTRMVRGYVLRNACRDMIAAGDKEQAEVLKNELRVIRQFRVAAQDEYWDLVAKHYHRKWQEMD